VRKDGSSVSGGELPPLEDEREFERAVLVVEVLDWRLRKGREGTR
jgi:hypothetical protein